MDANRDQLLSLLHLILPEEILEYFTIVNLEIRPHEVHCLQARSLARPGN